MTATEWVRVRDLFERLLDQSEPDALAWLDREAGDNIPLRTEVLSLLEHHKKAGVFLSEPATVEPAPYDDPSLEPGQVVGPYTIIREAGRGGMGRVYVASDARLGRMVALKAVRSQLADSAQRDRLRREARAAAALTHPGICTVYALEDLDGDLFIASEFIEGRTLRQEMADGGHPSLLNAVNTARDIAAAKSGWEKAKELIADPALHMVVLDEINIALRYDYLDINEVVEFLQTSKPPLTHVVLTGRNAKQELIDAADLVTEMTLVKHPFRSGIKAQAGVEF